jgi:hypothetical protein
MTQSELSCSIRAIDRDQKDGAVDVIGGSDQDILATRADPGGSE